MDSIGLERYGPNAGMWDILMSHFEPRVQSGLFRRCMTMIL